jgi:tetratricopeptide (TPR) repeat protein
LSYPRFRVVTRQGSHKLVVLFSDSNTQNDRFDFLSIGENLKDNVIFLNNGKNEWYQNGIPGLGDGLPATIEKIRNWADLLGVSEIYMIGGGMGGHGAALYGALAGANALAFGFEAVLDKPASRSLWAKPPSFKYQYPDLKPLLAKTDKPLFAYIGENDPIDLFTARHLADVDAVKLTTLRHVDHEMTRFLRGRKQLAPIIDAFIAGAPHPVIPEADNAAHVPGFADALYESFRHFHEADAERSETFARVAIGLRPHSEIAHYLLGRALRTQGRFIEAVPHFSAASAISKRYPDAYFYLAESLEKLGNEKIALAMYSKATVKWPDFAKPYYAKGLFYYKKSRFGPAHEFFVKAVERDPKNRVYREKMLSSARK